MRCLRTADQFIHTGLEQADEAHQEAHILLEKWEKFALKLDQRRKLLSIVVSFYKQTEDASERLSQIEREIRLENEKIRSLKERRRSSADSSRRERRESDESSTKSRTRTVAASNSSQIVAEAPTSELAQRHAVLSNRLAEVSASGLREGKLVLEKISKDDFEAKHVIRKVRCS